MEWAFINVATLTTGKILVESCQEVASRNKSQPGAQLSQVSSVGYEDIGQAAFGDFGRRLVSTAMYTEIVGICSLLFVVEVWPSFHISLQHVPTRLVLGQKDSRSYPLRFGYPSCRYSIRILILH